jgi:hypothetical protein
MSPDLIFGVANTVAAVGWLLLAVLPGREWVTRIVTGTAIPAIFAALYVAIVAGVATLFANPWLLLAGWVHYLAFDLLIGTWEARDARERRVPHVLLVPCLFLTFMFGPAGWLLYLGVRRATGRRALSPS